MSDGYRLAAQEVGHVLQRSNAERFEYFVHKVADWGEVWSLRTAGGWVLFGTDGGIQAAPFWPFREFAQQCAVGEWSDAYPEPIDLEAVVERWLPGLARDGRLVAVFPNASGESSTIGPLDLLERIECERDKISDD
ncbi:DUF2750 domain-containing protein [Lysobacter sp. MMG2]|uniref:DUF2750 domain-containing protein n=1 Tax=Lysobacter sp. MMG2 TaxID=2801338 RepID=UPI001C215450|nr:DUF2750 domain-containing protein [Lysobacter sp. MMG2]MBU8978015.1 DUF2750 domain-containing protein [Lysobacter sp. MMG2]